MILTADGHYVHMSDTVFEINYRYYNAEVSLAEPAKIAAGFAMPPFFMHEWACKLECKKINLKKYSQWVIDT